jgi:uncharacterized CHY-type Zn-finger protein
VSQKDLTQTEDPEVKGMDVDPQTRCRHYRSPIDIIAIKFKCCGGWFPCFECHAALSDHQAAVWPLDEYDQRAILCGNCRYQLTVSEYLDCRSVCPKCLAQFNPGCANHYHLYFEEDSLRRK